MAYHLAVNENQLPVPYPAIDRGDDGQNHGFVNLRANPTLIETIPEAQDLPPLINLLRAVNARTSRFASLGCEKTYSDIADENHPELKRKLCGYVDLCFNDVSENIGKGSFEILASQILGFAQAYPQAYFGVVSFELTRTTYSVLREAGINEQTYCMSVRLAGFGKDDSEALDRFASLMAVLTDFFTEDADKSR